MSDDPFTFRNFCLAMTALFFGIAMTNLFTVSDTPLSERVKAASFFVPFLLSLLFVFPLVWAHEGLVNAAKPVTSSPWAWFAVIMALWSYIAVHSLVALRQRDRSLQVARDTQKVVNEQLVPFRLALERYVLPRHLMPEQKAIISRFLERHPRCAVKCIVPKQDDEAMGFATDIRDAFQTAKWQCRIEEVESVSRGVNMEMIQTQENFRGRFSQDGKRADLLVIESFKLASLNIFGGSSRTSADVVADEIIISVGRRPHDYHQSWNWE